MVLGHFPFTTKKIPENSLEMSIERKSCFILHEFHSFAALLKIQDGGTDILVNSLEL